MRNIFASILLILLILAGCSAQVALEQSATPLIYPHEMITVIMDVRFLEGLKVSHHYRSLVSKNHCAWVVVAAAEFNMQYQGKSILITCMRNFNDKKA